MDNPSAGVTADALPTAQLNGVAWDQVVAGGTVYVGGDFSSARPAGSAAGQNESPRTNLMSYNLQTGEMTAWAPVVNGPIQVLAASPDGSRIYIGGSFTQVNGKSRSRIAAFNTADGSLANDFVPTAGSDVFAIAATSDRVYLGGWFMSMNGVARTRLAAVSAANGALLDWAPTANDTVRGLGLTANHDRVIVSGSFSKLNNANQNSIGSLDAQTGASYPFVAGTLIKNTTSKASVGSVKVVGDRVYASGYAYGAGNFEGAMVADAYTGQILNMLDCHGDTYDAVPMNGIVYSVSHHHFCSNVGSFPEITPRRYYYADGFTEQVQGTVETNTQTGGHYANWAGQPVGAMVQWWNSWSPGTYTGINQAGWTIETAGDYLVIGGEFTAINGKPQQGLVRFATRNVVTAPAVGPAGLRAESVPNLSSPGSTRIMGTFRSSYDPDNQTLTYKVVRSDRGPNDPVATLTAASTPWNRPLLSFTDDNVIPGWSYTYYVIAADPDNNSKTNDSATIAAGTENRPYLGAVLGDGPTHYWRLGQNPGSGSAPDSVGGTPLQLLNGVTSGVSGALANDSDTAASFGGTSTGTSGTTVKEDPLQTLTEELWFKTTSSSGGKLLGFGNSSTGGSSTYDRHLYLSNTGKLTFGLYPGSYQTITTPGTYRDGAWHHVVATLSGDGMKLYVDGALRASKAGVTSGRTTAGYWRVGGDKLSTSWSNGGSSEYIKGSIDEVAIYDKALNSDQVAAHYAIGKQSLPSNQAPNADFTASSSELTAAFDGSTSSDPDGSIVAYGWNFGDGSRATGANVTHEYALPGSYTVKLTVVDDQGKSATKTSSLAVDVDGGGAEVIAKDTFNRAGTQWGIAAVGGAWTYNAATAFSTDGSLGVLNITRAGSGPSATLAPTGNTQDLTIRTDFALNKQPTGGPYLHTLSARVNGTTSYRAVTRVETSGALKVYVSRVVSGAETVIKTVNINDFGYTAGERVKLRFDVHGNNPAVLQAKAWRATDPEPGAALVSTTDSTAVLQGSGALSITGYTSGAMTSVPLTSTIDDYLATAWVDTNAPPLADFTATNSGLRVAVDASASTDGDGEIASYAWDFGDAHTGTGKQTEHTYATAGTYSIRLTVTDNDGAQAVYTTTVTVERVNQPPGAVMATPQVTGLKVSFDGRASSDPDGSDLTYAWDFGDSETGEGAQTTHTYTNAGSYTVTLIVTDQDGATHQVEKTVILDQNQAPSAVIQTTVNGLAVEVDGSTSTDGDGTIQSYAWEFGDGATDSGVTAGHEYAAAGTYTVKLTVTDDDGATDTATKQVEVTSAPSNVAASDSFDRTSGSGWGSAPVGGTWSLTGSASSFTVGSGVGTIADVAGSQRVVRLNGVSERDVSILTDFALDKVPAGGNYYHQVLARTSGSSYYSLTARIEPAANVLRVYLSRVIDGQETTIRTTVISGFSYSAGELVRMRFDVSGGTTANLSGKVWVGSAGDEPSEATVSGSDDRPELRTAGGVGARVYLGSTMTSGPIKASIEEFVATRI